MQEFYFISLLSERPCAEFPDCDHKVQLSFWRFSHLFGYFLCLYSIKPVLSDKCVKNTEKAHIHKLKSKNWSDSQKLKKTMEASFSSNTSKLSIKQKMAIIAKENEMLRARSMISPTLRQPNCSNNQRPPPPPPPSWSTRGRGRGRGSLSRTSFTRCVDF